MFNRIATFFVTVAWLSALSACGTTATPQPEPASGSTPSLSQPADSGAPVQPVSEQPISEDNYVLGQGDRISIQVFDEPDLTMDASVSASGIINYSYLGDVRVKGKTPFELEQHITELLRNGYLVNPAVNVSVTQFRPFFIGGEVRSPGSYPFQPGLTLDKAIALAGGLTDRASQRQMFILKAGSTSNKQERSALSDPVGPGDTVTIKEGFF